MSKLPEQADVVIVGQGGIVGASVAHHLIEQGWSNIVGLDKSAVPSDISSTSHASDFCYMTSHDRMSCYTTVYSRQFYESLRCPQPAPQPPAPTEPQPAPELPAPPQPPATLPQPPAPMQPQPAPPLALYASGRLGFKARSRHAAIRVFFGTEQTVP